MEEIYLNSRTKKFCPIINRIWGYYLQTWHVLLLFRQYTDASAVYKVYHHQRVGRNSPNPLNQIYAVGAVMLAMVLIHTFCDMFISYKGHMMGAYMESDMRRELFDHFQKLSFGFMMRIKQALMTRTTNDILSLTELYHHGPEDIVISVLKFLGAFIILMYIDVKLTLIVFLFLPVMAVFAFILIRR